MQSNENITNTLQQNIAFSGKQNAAQQRFLKYFLNIIYSNIFLS